MTAAQSPISPRTDPYNGHVLKDKEKALQGYAFLVSSVVHNFGYLETTLIGMLRIPAKECLAQRTAHASTLRQAGEQKSRSQLAGHSGNVGLMQTASTGHSARLAAAPETDAMRMSDSAVNKASRDLTRSKELSRSQITSHVTAAPKAIKDATPAMTPEAAIAVTNSAGKSEPMVPMTQCAAKIHEKKRSSSAATPLPRQATALRTPFQTQNDGRVAEVVPAQDHRDVATSQKRSDATGVTVVSTAETQPSSPTLPIAQTHQKPKSHSPSDKFEHSKAAIKDYIEENLMFAFRPYRHGAEARIRPLKDCKTIGRMFADASSGDVFPTGVRHPSEFVSG